MDFKIRKGVPCVVEYGDGEPEAVKIAAENLKSDLRKVFGEESANIGPEEWARIRISTLNEEDIWGGKGNIPDHLCKGFCDENGIPRREAYALWVREGVLHILGADRRGTIYGIYDLCERMGVSPWYFWADVPVKRKEEYVLPDNFGYCDYPSVEYRGIFINDEEELEAWAKSHMGEETIGVITYEKVFELLLRLKGNYIWPAMHVNSFNAKKENGALAEKMGIVVGTSHCDMLMRSNNREWRPWLAQKGYEGIRYDYSIPGRNREVLREYWRESVEQNREFEVCYTLGMRGIHDSGFETEGLKGLTKDALKAAKISLLQQVISDQRKILKETLGRDTLMTFVPYKEVLPLYDGGLEVPEDITLVWSNDNYGHIRRYPAGKEKNRKGGNGIYYHNSYWAPPGMSYVFLCSIPLAHTANELRKAYGEGIRKLWVMNTGAMKPLEQEIEFFLRLGWEIGKENVFGEEYGLTGNVDAYVEDCINRNFSGGIGRDAASLLNDFSQLTNVRKLELMDYDAFSQTAYGDEAVVRIHGFEELFHRGNKLYASLPEEEKAAFFQLVLMRIHAAYYTNLAYYYGDRSTLMYRQGKFQAAGVYTCKARELEDARRRMLVYYNKIMLDGKWEHILEPEGFPPPRAAMMPVCTPPLRVGKPGLVVTVWNEEEPIFPGCHAGESALDGKAKLTFTRQRVKWIEIGNGGEGSIEFVIEAPEWIKLSQTKGTVSTECRILVWPEDTNINSQGVIRITEKNTGIHVDLGVAVIAVGKCEAVEGCGAVPECAAMDMEKGVRMEGAKDGLNCGENVPEYVEDDGVVAVEADSAASPCFRRIRRLGRGQGSLMEAFCKEDMAGMAESDSGKYVMSREKLENPLQYRLVFLTEGEFLMEIHRFPSLNSTGQIRVGISVDEGPIQILGTEANDEHRGTWRENVRNNVDRMYMTLPFLKAGEHRISVYAVDNYFAFSRFVVYTRTRKDNNYVGIEGCQELPEAFDSEAFGEAFYGKISLEPRAVEYAVLEREKDSLGVTDFMRQDGAYGEKVSPDWIMRRGEKPFAEQEGYICIDCASALLQSEYANTCGSLWEHCAGESYGRSGIAMYIRRRDLTELGEKHALNYQISCKGGEYTIWLLARFGRKEESYLGVGVDGEALPEEEIYHGGCLWRYEAEQIYRYVPLSKVKLTKGEHFVAIYAKAPGLRFDRICLCREGEGYGDLPCGNLPPMDSAWKNYLGE